MFKLLEVDADELAVDEINKISSSITKAKDLIVKADTLIWQRYNFEREESGKWSKKHPTEHKELLETLFNLEELFRRELKAVDALRDQEKK